MRAALTPFQRQMIAEGRCIWCGAPIGWRSPNRPRPTECRACGRHDLPRDIEHLPERSQHRRVSLDEAEQELEGDGE